MNKALFILSIVLISSQSYGDVLSGTEDGKSYTFTIDENVVSGKWGNSDVTVFKHSTAITGSIAQKQVSLFSYPGSIGGTLPCGEILILITTASANGKICGDFVQFSGSEEEVQEELVDEIAYGFSDHLPKRVLRVFKRKMLEKFVSRK